MVEYCPVLTQYKKIDLKIAITFLSKKIFIFPFLCNFVRTKTLDYLSANIDHVYSIPIFQSHFSNIPLIY